MGAKCPFIIFESADIDSAVDEAIEAAFRKKKEVIYRKKKASPVKRWASCHPSLTTPPSLQSGTLGVMCAGERAG